MCIEINLNTADNSETKNNSMKVLIYIAYSSNLKNFSRKDWMQGRAILGAGTQPGQD